MVASGRWLGSVLPDVPLQSRTSAVRASRLPVPVHSSGLASRPPNSPSTERPGTRECSRRPRTPRRPAAGSRACVATASARSDRRRCMACASAAWSILRPFGTKRRCTTDAVAGRYRPLVENPRPLTGPNSRIRANDCHEGTGSVHWLAAEATMSLSESAFRNVHSSFRQIRRSPPSRSR